MTVIVQNAGIEDLFVSLWDMNAGPTPVLLLDSRRINDHDELDIDIQPDGNGKGSVTWTVKGATEESKDRTKSGQQSGINENEYIKVDLFGV